jgi:ABC-type iron transport system FetAB permease component
MALLDTPKSKSIAAILVGLLSYRSFFTPRHQLKTAPQEY